MISKAYPFMTKESGIFLRSNFINFDPPLNCYVPSAWLPMENGFPWQQRPGHPDFAGKSVWRHFLKSKPTWLIAHTISPTSISCCFRFADFSEHFQWSEVVVLSRTVAMDLIERQESRYTQVRTTKIREMRGPGLLERRGRIFIRSQRHVLLFARSTSKKAVLLGLSTQVSAGK